MKIEFLGRKEDFIFDYDLHQIDIGNYRVDLCFFALKSEKVFKPLVFIPEQERIELSFIMLFICIYRCRYNSNRDGFISRWLQKQRWSIGVD